MSDFKPIITSFLDTDFYKFSMGQFIFKRYRYADVTFEFKDRSGAPLADYISEEELRWQLNHFRENVKIRNSELHYLRGTNEYAYRMFSEDYLEFLRNLTLPPYELRRVDNTFALKFKGPWAEVTHWEIPALAIKDELFYKGWIKNWSKFDREVLFADGKMRLWKKLASLSTDYFHDIDKDFSFSDFGTRRRFSKEHQEYVVRVLSEEVPYFFRGTSNVHLANKYNLMPTGTSAHELFVVIAAIKRGRPLKEAQNEFLQEWWDMYGFGLSIALNDTWGSDFFFKTAPPEVARNWKGIRQDSGDPIAEGEKYIKWLKTHKVDPREKLFIASDQLTVEKMTKIYEHFKGKLKVTFGWGTNLTNDFGMGHKPLSIVIKATEANGHGLVKLSNNIAKAIGRKEDIERVKKEVGYSETFNERCIY